MRAIKCILCIAIVYLLSPVNGLTERDALDGLAKAAIGAQTLAPQAGKVLADLTGRAPSGHDESMLDALMRKALSLAAFSGASSPPVPLANNVAAPTAPPGDQDARSHMNGTQAHAPPAGPDAGAAVRPATDVDGDAMEERAPLPPPRPVERLSRPLRRSDRSDRRSLRSAQKPPHLRRRA